MIDKSEGEDDQSRSEAESIAELSLTYEDLPIAFRVHSHMVLGEKEQTRAASNVTLNAIKLPLLVVPTSCTHMQLSTS